MFKQVFQEQRMIHTFVFDWYSQSGPIVQPFTRMTTTEDPLAAQLLTKFNMYVFRDDRRRTIKYFADEFGITYGTSYRILPHELGIHPVPAKFVPRILSVDHKRSYEIVVKGLRQALSVIQSYYLGSSLVVRAQFTVMVRKQSNNPVSGRAQPNQGRKRRKKS